MSEACQAGLILRMAFHAIADARPVMRLYRFTGDHSPPLAVIPHTGHRNDW